ncbi:hypothetical protein GCM10018962_78930 [Dactylosporangium matsuzakiense]
MSLPAAVVGAAVAGAVVVSPGAALAAAVVTGAATVGVEGGDEQAASAESIAAATQSVRVRMRSR